MSITFSAPQLGCVRQDHLVRRLRASARSMAVNAVWSVLVWKAQQGSGWDVLVQGPTRVASTQIDEVAVTDDERILATVLSLLPATAAAPSLRRAG